MRLLILHLHLAAHYPCLIRTWPYHDRLEGTKPDFRDFKDEMLLKTHDRLLLEEDERLEVLDHHTKKWWNMMNSHQSAGVSRTMNVD